jgi:hypothetical protein
MLYNIFYLSSDTLQKNFSFLNQIERCLEHSPIIQHFTIFSSFINQIERCLCHSMCKLEAYKFSLSIRSEGAMQKTQEEGEWEFA